MEKRKIIIDCDPGYDDAVAILLAGGSPALDVLAVTTVAGNQTIEKVTNNARRIVKTAGLDQVTVSQGAVGPIAGGRWETAGHVHGTSGLDGVTLDAHEAPLDPMQAPERIVDILMREPCGSVTLVPTGPLTNIARALTLEPAIVDRVREVVLMGGAVYTGNVGPFSEFNVFTDPEAARLVFKAGWKVVMIGLDVTHQSAITSEVIAEAAKLDNRAGKILTQILIAENESHRRRGLKGGAPIHDAVAVSYVIDPTLMETSAVPIDVEVRGELTRGMTVADFRRPAPAGCRTSVALELDQARFWRLLIEAVRNLR